MKTKLLAALLCLVCLGTVLTGCGSSGGSSSSSATDSSSETTENATPEATPDSHEITFDTPFTFDNLEITLHSNYSMTTLENQYSDHSGASIIAIPITVVNNSDETKGLNMFYFKVFGPNGTELDTISTYFMESDIEWAGEARSGATMESTMHILYDGDGEYVIEFDNFSEEVEVKLPISAA